MAHPFGTQTIRRKQDLFSEKDKYGKTVNIDRPIIDEVEKIAQNHNTSMATIALAGLKTKVTAPIVGATKAHHLDVLEEAIKINLSKDEVHTREALYKAHDLEGVMDDNRNREHNWTQYLINDSENSLIYFIYYFSSTKMKLLEKGGLYYDRSSNNYIK